jgi:hypothetical protein
MFDTTFAPAAATTAPVPPAHAPAGAPAQQQGAPWFLVGLSGLPQSGKRTAGHALTLNGYIGFAVSDAVRLEAGAAWNLPWICFTRTDLRDVQATGLTVARCGDAEFRGWMRGRDFVASMPRSPRWLMQQWAEFRSQQNPAYWLAQAHLRLTSLLAQGHRRIVVTDLSTASQALWMQALGGLVIRLHRPDTYRHGEEQPAEQLEGVAYDAWITNDGSEQHLGALTLNVVQEYFGRG